MKDISVPRADLLILLVGMTARSWVRADLLIVKAGTTSEIRFGADRLLHFHYAKFLHLAF